MGKILMPRANTIKGIKSAMPVALTVVNTIVTTRVTHTERGVQARLTKKIGTTPDILLVEERSGRQARPQSAQTGLSHAVRHQITIVKVLTKTTTVSVAAAIAKIIPLTLARPMALTKVAMVLPMEIKGHRVGIAMRLRNLAVITHRNLLIITQTVVVGPTVVDPRQTGTLIPL